MNPEPPPLPPPPPPAVVRSPLRRPRAVDPSGAPGAPHAAGGAADPWIDRHQLRVLLGLFMRLNMRGSLARTATQGIKARRGYIWVLAVYALMGLMFAGVVGLPSPQFTISFIVLSATFVMIGMAVLSEAGNVMFNPLEDDLLLHRPIGERTLVLAKLLNLAMLGAVLATAFNLFPTIAMFFRKPRTGLLPLAHLASIALLSLLAAASVVFLYGVMIRLVGRKRFDALIVWVQVAFSVVFMLGYQLVGPMLTSLSHAKPVLNSVWFYLAPTAWFAALESLAAGEVTRTHVLLALGGIAATLGLTAAAAARLARQYTEAAERGAGGVKDREAAGGQAGSPGAPTLANGRPAMESAGSATEAWTPPRAGWIERLCGPWLRDPVERHVFRLTLALMRRDRDTKLRLFPQLGYAILFPFIFILNPHTQFQGSGLILMIGWMVSFVPMQAIETLRYASNPAAAQLFYAAPLASAAPLFHGVRKAILISMGLPALLVVMVLLVVLGTPARDLLMLLAMVLPVPLIVLISARSAYVPLSRVIARGRQSSKAGALVFALMFIMGALAGVIWLSQRYGVFGWFLGAEALVVALFYPLMLRRIGRRPLDVEDE